LGIKRMPRTFKLTLAYDGTAYTGWQWQPKFPTIQGEVEAAILAITKQSVRVVASGRTDTGVHALKQVASVELETSLTPKALQRAINSELPCDIVILDAVEVEPGFHAICDAVRKRYRYVIHDGPLREIFRRGYLWHVKQRLDATAMHQAARLWVGQHDFAAFESSGSRRLETVRTVFEASVSRVTDGITSDVIEFEIEADGFLYNMVRTMAGTLVEVGRGKLPISWAGEVLASRDRRIAGMKAPACGLFLINVEY
jgi:tRNA pseudouridine38-40 synthase